MKRLLSVMAVACLGAFQVGISQTVEIIHSKSPQQLYATKILGRTLLQQKYRVNASHADFSIKLSLSVQQSELEAFKIEAKGNIIAITGGDERGLIYGVLAVVEDLKNGTPIHKINSRSEKPHVPFRAIKFDLPWDTYRHSYALDLHGTTCLDTNYWRGFLDMMVENRFNSLSLWNLHPYPYLIKSKNFPEASPFNASEMSTWKLLFHSIFRMARERAIDTYIVPFNIFVTPEFAKAHHVAMDNLEHHFFVRGDTSEIIKRYTRESVTQMLQEYPDLTGIGLTLGEGMAGMTPDQREMWMRETIIEGMRLANRKSKLVHRIPFSSTTASLGATSVETERLTRKSIEAEADLEFIVPPIWADLKFNWSHAHSTPKLIKVHGGKLYDTYFNPVPTKYKVTWTARNEDFFCLRWGSPDFVRSHITTNTPPYVGGYFIGSETYIPAKDYFTTDTVSVPWKYAFERQWLFYKIWGRLLYNPATSNEVFKAEYVRRYGGPGKNLQEAMSLASNTPLRLASLFDFTWDFSLYSEGMMALDSKVKRVGYISVDRLINQPVTDPDYVSVANYVKKNVGGEKFENNRITPPILSHFLEQDCNKALDLMKKVSAGSNKSLIYEIADIRTWSYLGLHLSEKLKGAVALQTYRVTGKEEYKQAAVQHLENALRFWDTVIKITRPLYNDMPLVHYSEQDGKHWKENDHLRFHWQLIRPDVQRDIEIAKSATQFLK